MARNDSLATMTVKIAANTAQFNAAIKQTQGQLTAFGNSIKTAAASFVAGFGAIQISNFALEVSKLAGEAEGVRAAFEKLPNSVRLMNDLKEATAGTVSELDLMKRAVTASNFGISLEALPKLLEFATVRAKQTGQSIDYLVDSIVTGIGRKSKLILDNLGISAVQLTEALGGASTAAASIEDVADAVGNIAAKELERMGSLSENASTKLERLSANWVNLKVAIGDAANGTGVFGTVVDGLNESMTLLASKNLDFWEKLSFFVGGPGIKASAIIKDIGENAKKAAEEQTKQAQVVLEVDRAMKSANPEAYIKAMAQHVYYAEILNEFNKRIVDSEKAKGAEIENIANLTEKLNLLQADQITLTGQQLISVNQEIKSIEEKIKKLRELGIAQKDSADAEKKAIAERDARVRALDASRATGNTLSGFTDLGNIGVNGNPIASVQNAIAEATKKANEEQKKQIDIIMMQREAWGNLGKAMGDTIAQTIASGEPLLRSLSKITASVINQLEQIALARMIADSSRFGIVGIIAAAAGFGIVKGLFNRIGKDNSQGTFQNNSYGYTGGGYGMSTVRVYQRGTDMQGTLDESARLSKRTKG